MNKKGIELSVNFLVILILAIVIFGFGIYLFTGIITKASELSRMTQDDLNRRIESLQCSGNVCFAVNYRQIPRGEFYVFGLKVYSREQGNFEMTAAPASSNPGFLDYAPETFSFSLKANEEARIGIGFEIPKNASSGLYIYNVEVKKGVDEYPPKLQFRIEVP